MVEFDNSNFELPNLSQYEKEVLRTRIITAYDRFNGKYKRTHLTYTLLNYTITILSLIITILNLYLNQQSKYTREISLTSAIISAGVASINQIFNNSKLKKKVVLYKQARTILRRKIWIFLRNPTMDFNEFCDEIESDLISINQKEMDLFRDNSKRSVRRESV